jgi:hypothetical protein
MAQCATCQAITALACLAMTACTQVSGVVLESRTETPVANVFVVLIKHTSSGKFVEMSSRCFRAPVVLTDAKGRFSFPPDFAGGSLDVQVYRRGYSMVSGQNRPQNRVLVYEDGSSSVYRFHQLRGFGMSCEGSAKDPAFTALVRELHEERVEIARKVKALAQTEAEHQAADHLLHDVGLPTPWIR